MFHPVFGGLGDRIRAVNDNAGQECRLRQYLLHIEPRELALDVGEHEGTPFIAMELVRGTDLQVLLSSGEEILLAERLDIAIQVTAALS